MSKHLACLLVAAGLLVAGGCNQKMEVTGSGTMDDPVTIPYMGDPIVVDGDLSEWDNVGAMPAPFAGHDANVKLAWREDGLYGAYWMADEDIRVYPGSPWEADSFELFIEKDYARAADWTDNSPQWVFGPSADGSEGEALVMSPNGVFSTKGIQAQWKKMADQPGYMVEFMIPADQMAPAQMQAGTKIGLNFATNNDGRPVVQFFSDKSTDQGFRTPKSWGSAILVK